MCISSLTRRFKRRITEQKEICKNTAGSWRPIIFGARKLGETFERAAVLQKIRRFGGRKNAARANAEKAAAACLSKTELRGRQSPNFSVRRTAHRHTPHYPCRRSMTAFVDIEQKKAEGKGRGGCHSRTLGDHAQPQTKRRDAECFLSIENERFHFP